MSHLYPRIIGDRRKPNPLRDGDDNYGTPCIICGRNTIGQKWVQTSWFRGEDELIRVCTEHWHLGEEILLKNFSS